MMNEKIYIKYNSRGRGEKYYEAVKKGVIEFCKFEDNWYINLSDNESRNCKTDLEACFLCHGIWTEIMGNCYNDQNPQSGNSFNWCSEKDSSKNNTTIFHFDIMNNASISTNNLGCYLAKKCSKEKLDEWKKVYHTIGNMAPIPWFEIYSNGNVSINSQFLHKALDERWDFYLQLLKNNWSDWNHNERMTFEKYMILTCQQMYFEDIFKDIKNIDVITIDDICGWGNKINEGSKLICLTPSGIETVNDVADKIIRLIKIRCKAIGLLLNEKLNVEQN